MELPNGIRAIDGKHVMIQCPFNSGSLCNNKSYFMIVLLAVAAADYRFVMVDVGSYRSSNDGGVLNHTTFFKCLRNKTLGVPPSRQLPHDMQQTLIPHVLLGDGAFSLRCDLLQPFAQNALTNETRVFNYRLSRARRVVENAFCILANYWTLYHQCIYMNPDNVTTVVKATVVLHNILTLPSDRVQNEVLDDRVQIFDDAFEDVANQWNCPATAANKVKRYFVEYFNSDQDSVDWQNEYACVH